MRKLFYNNSYAIVGGLGYAGLNNTYNANLGLYRSAPITREEEIKKSEIMNKLHFKLSECVFDKKIFFATHMPKENWSFNNHVSSWYYLSGHTHKNYYCDNDNKHIFSDNQIGYDRLSFGFKYITTTSKYNYFEDFEDGIHEISREQYIRFYIGIGTHIDFNRKFKNLYMVKRNNTYCFLIKQDNVDNFKLLSGGNILNVGNHDLKYFYDNLSNYANSIKKHLESYSDFQKRISKEIKSIGGNGYIHGCIIDIDYYNHLFINPLDASITPYFAYSMTEKYVYQNLASLLKYKCNELYLNYTNEIQKQPTNSLVIGNKNLSINKKSTFVASTEMYRISRILKGLQYTTKYNIVRMWNDSIIADSSQENGKLIVNEILNSNHQKRVRNKS